MIDTLGDRMKAYENVTRTHVVPRSYTILRIDGRAFHTYCRGLKKPIDKEYVEDFDHMAAKLCEEIPNVKLGYVQSDELTLLLCDFEKHETKQFFDGNIQKIVSVVASTATAHFNLARLARKFGKPDCYENPENLADFHYYYDPGLVEEVFRSRLATFDCRVFNVPTRTEVMNCFIWRNKDCSRNAISMTAQSLFSAKELHGKSSLEKITMIYEATGVTWDQRPLEDRFGRILVKETRDASRLQSTSEGMECEYSKSIRNNWSAKPAWNFTEDKEKLISLIPENL